LRIAALVVTGFVLLPVALVPSLDLSPIMAPQTIVATVTFLGCAALLGGAPSAQATRGSRVLRIIFFLLATLWFLYIPAFMEDACSSVTSRAAGLLSVGNCSEPDFW
jgi:hypothetical protein